MRDGALRVEGVVAGYGGGVVLDDVSLSVTRGEAVALVGRNGAGKTTLLKTIMGLLPITAGTIMLDGERLAGRAPFAVARRGVSYVPQGREILDGLTVEQNLLLGDLRARNADLAYAIFPALDAKRRQLAGGLSGGQQQQLAIGRALMARPKLMLLDEPSEGVQPSIVGEIAGAIGRIAAETGMGLILVEQNIELALRLASRVVFLEAGRVVASEPASILRADPSAFERRIGL